MNEPVKPVKKFSPLRKKEDKEKPSLLTAANLKKQNKKARNLERKMSLLKIVTKRSSVQAEADSSALLSPELDFDNFTSLERELYVQARHKGQDSADTI